MFLKGCPLRCAWCCNPESQRPHPQLRHRAARCTACGTCVAQCPAGALSIEDGVAVADPALCIGCFCCQEMCPEKAIALAAG